MSQECENCRHWVGYNNVHAHSGECTLIGRGRAAIRIVCQDGMPGPNDVHVSLVTSFDWSCGDWEAKPATTSDLDAMSCRG